MMKRIAQKLRSRAGESIGETLIALLISSLALLMLAGAISTTTRIVTHSNETMDAYYAADRGLAARDTGEASLTVTLNDGENTWSYNVNAYENATFSTRRVIAYAPIAEP